MDLAHRHHLHQSYPIGFVQNPQAYELQQGDPYGMNMEPQQLPRSLGPQFSLQTSGLAGEPAWPQRVLTELKDLLVLLSPDSRVLYVSPSCRAITGFDSTQLEQNLLSRFIHDDDKAVFARELRDCIATARPLRCHFRIYRVDNSTCLLEANGHPHLTTLNSDPDQRQFCHGVFLMCRPYPTRSSQLLDSFLEHKIENIRLNQQIAQLKEEEEQDLNASQQAKQTYVTSSSSSQASSRLRFAAATGAATTTTKAAGRISNPDASASSEENESSDTLGNLDDPDSTILLGQAVNRAVAQGEDISHIDGIELMTGLHYAEGERSQGISTGVRHGRLVQCTGVNALDRDGERRKRLKGDYMCTDCGTSDSPEWRKGPEGPKTLCNACGLRWAKKEKKR